MLFPLSGQNILFIMKRIISRKWPDGLVFFNSKERDGVEIRGYEFFFSVLTGVVHYFRNLGGSENFLHNKGV